MMQRDSTIRPAKLTLGNGKHTFGGLAIHAGATPRGSAVPLHRVVTLDATDPLFPVKGCPSSQLPLYYPMKYGTGGAELQYAINKKGGIDLIYVSKAKPDESPYVEVDAFPEIPGKLVELTYEEARLLFFLDVDNHFQPQGPDRELFAKLDTDNLIRIGGSPLSCQGEVHFDCRHPKCSWRGRSNRIDLFAIVPTFSNHVDPDLWHEYQGAEFCFGLCQGCGSVIGVNRA